MAVHPDTPLAVSGGVQVPCDLHLASSQCACGCRMCGGGSDVGAQSPSVILQTFPEHLPCRSAHPALSHSLGPRDSWAACPLVPLCPSGCPLPSHPPEGLSCGHGREGSSAVICALKLMSCSKLRNGPACGSACQSSFYFAVCPSLLSLAALPGTQRHQLKAVPPETVVQLLRDVVVAFAIPISSMRGKIKFKAPIGLSWWFSA